MISRKEDTNKMPLEWTHEKCRQTECDGTTDCPGFPTIDDRINMARAAYEQYAESDGMPVFDFALDVLLFAQSEHVADKKLLFRLAKQARREWGIYVQRNRRGRSGARTIVP